MSQQTRRLDVDALSAPVCEFCGEPIEESARDCAALDEGWCRP